MLARTPEARATRDELRRLIRAIEARPAPRRAQPRVLRLPLEDALSGGWQRVDGDALVRSELFADSYLHGTQSIAALRDCPGDVLALLAGTDEIESRSADELVFLDIETTGLGGSGAMVFLVTTGRLVSDGFLLRQYLAPSPAAEGALIEQLGADTGIHGERPVLATYNGRVFDAPILDQRSTMHRMRGGYEALTQLDVLSPMRHGFRATLPSRRLGFVEYELLGLTRPPDEVAGGDIPGWYFRFLRSGDHRFLEPLVLHNALDVLSLAALAARLVSVLRGTETANGLEHLAAGRLFLRAGREGSAERHLQAAIDTLEDGWIREQAVLSLAVLHKRAGRRELAAELWHRVVEHPHGAIQAVLIELAKHYEHAARDYGRALGIVERAITIEGSDPALQHRRSRLLRRLEREAATDATR